MRPVRPSQRALPLTFFVYVVQAGAAVMLALPLGLELGGDVRGALGDAIGRAVWLDRVAELVPVVRAQARTAALFGLLWLVLSPWLQMAWLSALARPCSVRGALDEGARLYFRAWRVSLWVLLVLALAGLPLGLAVSMALWALSERAEPQLHDLVLAGACAGLLALLWVGHVLHDLARARALSTSAWSAVRGSLGLCLRPRVQARAIGFSLAGAGLRGAPLLVGALGVSLPAALSVALLQSACFAALLARAAWLSRALACVGERHASRDPG